MVKLEKTITPTIRKYAGDEKHMAAVRENCRKAVEEFVQDWLVREHQWGEGKLRGESLFSGRNRRTAGDSDSVAGGVPRQLIP